MGYRSTRACVVDLQRHGRLVRIDAELDPHLELAEVQRRVYRAGGPALWFANVKGCRFGAASNLFGTLERTRFLFRDTIERVRKMVELKIDPPAAMRQPWRYWDVPLGAVHTLPKAVRRGPVTANECRVADLPQVVSWPGDGGPFVTLPQVYSEDVRKPGPMHANLGMYRVQLAGNEYTPEQVGIHYQIHRGIGVHHAAALEAGVPFRVAVAVGGPPAMTLAAVMPLPEGLSELVFAGALAGRRVRMVPAGQRLHFPAEADFVIVGTIAPHTKPEGPFGDHLGYYSLVHEFPVLDVEHVYHRTDAVWPFTVVGRPPQEDTAFGQIIHEITGPVIPTVLPGVKAVHAVDASGVHPLLLAIGGERYVPYADQRVPQELLTQANAILGQGQLSLAKYLFVVAAQDAPGLDVEDVPAFLRHLLERVDWSRDLHFQTRTTCDTLDYSGTGFNQGSKLVIAAAGAPRRTLATAVPGDLSLPEGFGDPRLALPGVMTLRGSSLTQRPAEHAEYDPSLKRLCATLEGQPLDGLPLVVLVDDSEFAARTPDNFLWTTFTRSDPASDVHGVGGGTFRKHFGCTGPLVIDARIKPRMAPPLVEDAAVTARIDDLCRRGGPLHGLCG